MTAEALQTILAGVTAVIAALTPIMLALIARRTTKTAETVRQDLDIKHIENSAQLSAIKDQGAHTQSIVNSERDRLIAKVEELRQEVLRLATYKAQREQRDVDDAR